MNKARRIGIMGGTFDPPHLAHIVPVEIAAAEFDLDLVWFVPAFIPPHKQDQCRTDPFHRTAMLSIALRNFPKFQISTLELLRGDVSFTIETIRELQSRVGAQDTLFFIMGSDSFLEVQTWYAPAELLVSCQWIVIHRGASNAELNQHLRQLETQFQVKLEDRIHFASAPHYPYSSTEIGKSLAEGRNVSAMLDPELE